MSEKIATATPINETLSLVTPIASVTRITKPRRARASSVPPAPVALPPIVMPSTPNVVDYVYDACANPVAALIGAAFGAWIPYALHGEVHTNLTMKAFAAVTLVDPATWKVIARTILVLIGLAYSVTSVSGVLHQAVPSPRMYKAITFTLVTEGAMTVFGREDLGLIALVLLCVCNALAMASTITRGSQYLTLARVERMKRESLTTRD